MMCTDVPALILAPMDGVTDAAMRALQGETGAFSLAVSEFLRVSQHAPPRHVFLRHVPELATGSRTQTGLPVQVQLLGGDPERMAQAALTACEAGATAIDINFGCPAPTVNRHDGGATLLKFPCRIRAVTAAIRAAIPAEIPVSAKLRLGWDTLNAIHENAEMAAEGGAAWITIHGRTRVAGYAPPAYWEPIGLVRERLGGPNGIPVVANGDIWTIEDFRRCRDQTGCSHFMLGRGALANPLLPFQAARELGIAAKTLHPAHLSSEWAPRLRRLVAYTEQFEGPAIARTPYRIKQWLRLAAKFGDFTDFERIKTARTSEELLELLTDELRQAA
ncbi:MAG TPA: tRNA-dihydrouridine synthase family protein [Chthonomonadaceae bacterium]|nr:tRNA-dihydrouridine synthase family protein [Chthonomonadaceae bacterium]